MKREKPVLRVIEGGKSTAKETEDKVMTEIGLIDRQDMERFLLVKKAMMRPRLTGNEDSTAESQQEEVLLRKLLEERMALIRASFPDVVVDLKRPFDLPPEIFHILFSPPIHLTKGGRLVYWDHENS